MHASIIILIIILGALQTWGINNVTVTILLSF